jgi:hypothetical protein
VLDLALARERNIAGLLGNGEGTRPPPVTHSTVLIHPGSIVAGDVDGDVEDLVPLLLFDRNGATRGSLPRAEAHIRADFPPEPTSRSVLGCWVFLAR